MTEQRGPRSGRVDALPTLAGFRRDLLTSDLVAGLTVWAVLVPEALAYATIAGVSPVVGLYAAVPALVLYTVFGSSRHLVVGPMSATAAMSAATVADLAARSDASYVDLTVGVALVTGALAIVAGLLRLGFVASFISEPVLKGFIIGLALTIIVGQLPELFGVEGGGEDFFERVWELIGHLGDTQAWTIGVGAASLAVVLGLRRLLPRLPGSLVAVVLGILAVSLFDLEAHGVEIVGPIESGLPTFGLPDLGLGDYGALVGPAVGILLVAFAEGLAAAKTFASKEHYSIDIDRELVGVGAANIGSGLSSGMVVSGSLSKTAVNGAAGARSQVSGLTVAALTVLTSSSSRACSRTSPGHPRRGGRGRRRRPGRRPSPRPAVAHLQRRPGRDLRPGRPGRLHRRGGDAARCPRLRHPCPGSSSASPCPRSCSSTGRRAPTSPSSDARPATATGSRSALVRRRHRSPGCSSSDPSPGCSTPMPTTWSTRSASGSTPRCRPSSSTWPPRPTST